MRRAVRWIAATRRAATAAPIVAETAHAPTNRRNGAIHSGRRQITTRATRAAAIRSRGPTIRRLRVLTPRRAAAIRHRAATTRLRLDAAILLLQVAVATQRLAVAEAATLHRAIVPVAVVEAPIMGAAEAVLLMAVEAAEVRRTRVTNSRFARV